MSQVPRQTVGHLWLGGKRRFSSGRKNLDDFLQTRWLQDAINWNFCVIGEVDNRITWNIVETKLPVLIRELTAMLGE